jgi:thiosulfate/3-mercaptopyruvate sulfurtransferase
MTNDSLVDAAWVAAHAEDPNVRLIESNQEGQYGAGHLPDAYAWDWEADILGTFRLRPMAAATMEALLSRSGITPDTTIVLYGTWPAFPYWLLTIFGHRNVRLLDGGREVWLAEGRPLTTTVPSPPPTTYRLTEPNWSVRSTHTDVLAGLTSTDRVLVDVRTIEEYRGEHMWPGEPPGYCQRAGHIPGARHLLWSETTTGDGRFRPVSELRDLVAAKGLSPDREVIPYCTIGGRSSYVWFVLSQLLGFPRVRLYDGSWLEWAHLVDAPIERSLAQEVAPVTEEQGNV